ncbi:MAG: enoyl-CoA hydratase/isomerase family protein [Myxococcota bacterium]|nr:enoyl-CoA hydratase/isomerase family protein [Myxococcota bacterium]
MLELQKEGEVLILRMDAGENRFSAEAIRCWNELLDEADAVTGNKALVTTGSGKFYSNGLDLEYMQSGDVEPAAYIGSVLAIMARVLTFPAVTVAAMNGHAFGAGAQIALAHDYRVMRGDRGYFCMPEIDLGMPLHPGMTALIQARLPIQTAHEVIVTGTRYPGPLALERSIVDRVADEAEVVSSATEWAASLAAKAAPVMSRLKAEAYPQVLAALNAQMKS